MALDVSIVVVNYNTGHLLQRLFEALDAAKGSLEFEVVVVDNASTDDSVEILKTLFPTVTLIINSKNIGFGRANNQAIPHLRGRYFLLLNTDAFVATDTIEKTVKYMDENLTCGVLGVKLVDESGALQPSCRYFPTPFNVFLQRTGLARLFPAHPLVDDMDWDHASIRRCDWVPGCYYLLRSEIVHRLGLFDQRFFLYYEEIDHCRMVRSAGWDVIYYPYTEVVHIGGESAKRGNAVLTTGRQISSLQIESELLYFRKYFGIFGLILSVGLAIIADVFTALNSLLRKFDVKGGRIAWQHLSTVLKVLCATRLAARPTR